MTDSLNISFPVCSNKTVFHYGGQIVLVAEGKTAPRTVHRIDKLQELKISATGALAVTDEAQALYHNGTLFHGESLQGISDIVHCDDKGLLLACQVPAVASTKQHDFPLPTGSENTPLTNIFANDLVYQAMLVWVKKQLGLGSLPSTTASWTVYREVVVGEAFYLQLSVVSSSHTSKEAKKSRGYLTADIQLLSRDNRLLAEVKSAKVTASEGLNRLFLANSHIDKKKTGEKV